MQTYSMRGVLMGSVAMLCISGANAQTQDQAQAQGTIDAEACVALSNRLAQDSSIEDDVRTGVEEIIAQGDAARCEVIVTTWETEGTFTRESLELVATDEVTERVIVQQEVEVGAEVAVYQPPAEVGVDTGTPEIVWSMPRQNVQIDEQAPQITVRQGQPVVSVEMPQPRVTVMIPEPEVIVTWPDSTANVAALQPNIEVRIPEPVVSVNVPEPIVELALQGDVPENLVQLDDGRFAPEGTSPEELEPRISLQGQEPTITQARSAEEPEIVFNRPDPVVRLEEAQPDVRVEVVGEPEIRILQQAAGQSRDMSSPDAAGTGAETAPQTDN